MREREGWNEAEEGERERGWRRRQREGEIQRQTVMGKRRVCVQ
jgi:hypothetical protein